MPAATSLAHTQQREIERLDGEVAHVVFRNPETGYTVCVVKTRDRREITVVGSCPALWEGEFLHAEGYWQQHHTHGRQFQAIKMECTAPTTPAGILRYLASGMIDGIGPVLAERIVKKFGAQTLEIIERESARLEAVEGIGRKRRLQIKEAWNAQKAVRDIMVFLHGYGIGTAHANRIYRAYGEKSIALVRENPYRLAAEIWGIGFKTADRIARNMGVPPDSLHRACAGIVHTLQTMAEEGHCYAERQQLLQASAVLLEIQETILQQALETAVEQRALVVDADRFYLPPLYQAETGTAFHLRRLLQYPPASVALNTEKALQWAMQRMNLAFAPAQEEALRTALAHKIVLITGGPGVGKTTLIKALVDIWQTKKQRVVLAAPTGRAAKRMQEATAHAASTLHRLLKVRPFGGFEHDQHHPLEGDVFILDETSMVDIALMHAFLRALPNKARLVLVGDADQLPSVGPGNVLRDIINSGAVPTVKLTTIFRQSGRSWIVHNAHRVNQGQWLELPPPQSLADFYFVQETDPQRLIQRTVEFVTRHIPRRFQLDPRTDIQVLSPMRRNSLGADNLNLALQQIINPTAPALAYGSWNYRLGDRVMQLRNNYEKDIYNGDIGWICEVEPEQRRLAVNFDDRKITYTALELDELCLAYASSIHKAQGCEYPAVVILMADQHYHLLQRNLLYTAITRARQLACLLGSRKAVGIAIRNDRILTRQTALSARLKG